MVLLALFVLAQFFQNFGPNSTTFIVPGECFPTRYRSTAHGLSAASGKIGAIIAQTCIGTLVNHGCDKEHKIASCLMSLRSLPYSCCWVYLQLCLFQKQREELWKKSLKLVMGKLTLQNLALIDFKRMNSLMILKKRFSSI